MLVSITSFSFVFVSCAPPPRSPPDADAEVYVNAYCEDLHSKCNECGGPIPEEHLEACDVQACVEFETEQLGEECFALQNEFVRCRFERLSCDEYFGILIDTSLGSTCYAEFLALSLCVIDAQEDE